MIIQRRPSINDLSYEELLQKYREALLDLAYAEHEIRTLRQSEENWMIYADQLEDRLSEAGLL